MANEEKLNALDFKGTQEKISQEIAKLIENQQKLGQASAFFDEIKGKIKKEISEENYLKIADTLDSAHSAIEEGKKNVGLVKEVMEMVKQNISEIEKIYGVKAEIQNQILSPVTSTIRDESKLGIWATVGVAIVGLLASIWFSAWYAKYTDKSQEIITNIEKKYGVVSDNLVKAASGSNLIIQKVEEKYNEVSGKLSETASAGNIIVEKIGQKYEEVSRRLESLIKHNNSLTELLRLETQALGGSRKAFEEIEGFMNNREFPFQDEAIKIQYKIRNHFANMAFNLSTWEIVDWNKIGFTEDKVASFSFEKLRNLYSEISSIVQNKNTFASSVCFYILKRDDVKLEDKIRFSIEIIEKDLSLNSVVYAQRFLMQTFNLREYSVDFKGWVGIGKQKFEERFPGLSLNYGSISSSIATSSELPLGGASEPLPLSNEK